MSDDTINFSLKTIILTACISVRYHYLIQKILSVYSRETVTAKTLFDLLSDPFKPLSFITARIVGASKVLLGDTMLFV